MSINIEEINIPNSRPIDMKDGKGQTPLWLAAKSRCKEVVDLLLEKGANVDLMAIKKRTVLHALLEDDLVDETEKQACVEITKVLIKKGAPIQGTDSDGKTLLHLAARIKHKEVLMLLLPHFYNYDNINMFGNTAAHVLLDHVKNEDNEEEKEYVEIIELMLKKSPNILLMKDSQGRTLLHIAAKNKQRAIMKMLLTHYK